MAQARHDANAQTALDMQRARETSKLDVEAIQVFLAGRGRKRWEHGKKLQDILSREPLFSKRGREFLTRKERYIHGTRIMKRAYELQEEHGWSPAVMVDVFQKLYDPLPINLHYVAFEPVFMSQGSEELLKRYGTLVATRGIIGCYLQTELGHGTNVASLETTATFLPDTDEFEIHSPSITSTKWWIGALGKTATHGVVQAKLILPGGRDMGPHLFFVQLRSLDDHRLLPGIDVGDIGPKALGGNQANDNGYARFSRVRIPRFHMLSKFAQVTREGEYVKPPHAKLSYGGMLTIRANMVTGAGWTIARGITIALRYTTVRRQGELDESGLERQVLKYPSTYYRLIPILARSYVFIALGRRVLQAFQEMSAQLASGNTTLLPEMHAITCGLKVLVTTAGINDLETARRSMGGHGYSAFAGVGQIYADYLPAATYEGDNFVLDGQVVRAALKSHKSATATSQGSTERPPSSAYLRLLHPSASKGAQSRFTFDRQTCSSPSQLALLLEWRAAKMVAELASTVSSAEGPDASASQRVSRAVTEAFVARQVETMLGDLRVLPGGQAEAVRRLYILYLLTTVESALADLLSFDLVAFDSPSSDPARGLRLAIKSTCAAVLPDAIALTDAFGFSDWDLDSALGVHDGWVYEALLERVRQEPMNAEEVTPGYEESIKAMLEKGQRLAETRAKL
ncbi:peroxisomal oxidase [Coniophora puteana RWD-64-598 SS2]|uniref:Acyl-coenzyme A oxidase n=1 Tax=Coniophora puteana (strain RWD-64-598) TaxID=741705 RepID=A0A5M3MDI5_CONPW|nr:peroxisomal oxidase [Coniophora puteana RWD-64-598 SS2]EIW76904.1 peroxisomal oxidase [Coniophora puteana RWD-64-598 SS2]